MIITYTQIHRTDKWSQHSSIIWPVWLNGSVFVYKLSGCRFESRYCHSKTSDIAPVSSKELLDIQATRECRFTLKRVRYKIITQIHRLFSLHELRLVSRFSNQEIFLLCNIKKQFPKTQKSQNLIFYLIKIIVIYCNNSQNILD